jgi:hypothetical protein
MIWCRSCPFWKFARSIARLQKCCKLWYFPFSLVYICVLCVWLKCTIKWKLCVITSSEKSPWCFTKVWGWKQDFQSIKGKYHYDTVTTLSPSSPHCHHHYNPHQHRVITINLWCSIASTTATTNFISTIMINPTNLGGIPDGIQRVSAEARHHMEQMYQVADNDDAILGQRWWTS